MSSFTYLVSLCLGAYYVSTGKISVGALLTFITLAGHLVNPLTELAGQWAGFQRSVSAVERVVRVLEEPAESAALPGTLPAKPGGVSVEFDHVSFSYDGNRKVLDGFRLHIPAGQVAAIVGPSGAGKTTVFHLLQGFYSPDNGRVLTDGIPVQGRPLSELRSTMAYVPQDTFLFSGTIRDNLAVARPGVEEQDMREAAEAAQILDFILGLPQGWDTEIGERGVRLSGGQKQRLAIARAILREAPILLLDEATSALDSETERGVKEALEHFKGKRTTLVIAHRLSTIRNADIIIVMRDGQIVESGSHEELMQRGGYYRELTRAQWQTEKEPEKEADLLGLACLASDL